MNPCCFILEMNAAAASVAAPGGSKAAPPKFKQKEARQFKSKAPKAGQKGWVCKRKGRTTPLQRASYSCEILDV